MKAKHWLVIVSHYQRGHARYQDISRRGHLQYMRIIREQLLADRTPLKITASQQGMQMLFAVQPDDPDYAGHKRANTCMDLMCSMLFKMFSNIKEIEIWGYSAEPAVQGSCCLWYYQWYDMEGGHLMTLPEELQPVTAPSSQTPARPPAYRKALALRKSELTVAFTSRSSSFRSRRVPWLYPNSPTVSSRASKSAAASKFSGRSPPFIKSGAGTSNSALIRRPFTVWPLPSSTPVKGASLLPMGCQSCPP
jgi:hypothetical protein